MRAASRAARAAVLPGLGCAVRVETLRVRLPADDEVVVRMTASGVCHSDMAAVHGAVAWSLPAVLGHEGTGVVESVGSAVTRARVGDTVVLSGIPSCGHCFFCSRGENVLCERSEDVWARPAPYTREDGTPVTAFQGLGTFAELSVVSELCVVPVGSVLPPEQAALIGCAVMTGVGAVLIVADVEPGASVAVLGCGGIGQAMVQAAVLVGATKIIAVDPMQSKRAVAKSFGATHGVDAAAPDVIEQVRDICAGRGPDYVFEAFGRSSSLSTAYQMTRPGGVCVLAGVPGPDEVLSLPAQEVVLSGRTIRSCRWGGGRMDRDVPRLVDLASTGRLDLGALISRTMALDDVQHAFTALHSGEGLRSIITNFGGV
jgi:S-(hydroxymethyl)glutathione dehydrogenase / alcohol dehydrogenase